MRLARFAVDGPGLVGYESAGELIEVGLSWPELLETVTSRRAPQLPETGRRWPRAAVHLLPPLDPHSRGLFCIGMNYAEHSDEAGASLGPKSSHPPLFLKLAASMAGPDDDVALPFSASAQFDWEAELGVVIGRGGRDIEPEGVAAHIAGYTIVNDVTARDLQRQHGQWLIGKSVDASSPMGPWVTTADEIPYPPELEISLAVNGDQKQRGNTSQMIHAIADLISMVSQTITLQPGDTFATGTPSGVGFTRQPPEYLTTGDKMTTEIQSLGVLSNVIK